MFSTSRVWHENAYSRPQNGEVWGGFDPLNGGLSHRDPQKALMVAETHRMSH